jgi:DNA-binding NtrC family response regulator
MGEMNSRVAAAYAPSSPDVMEPPPSSLPAGIAESPIYCTDLMRRVVAQVEKFALSNATVLITGESGTGKELVARLLHNSSRRSSHPYVRVNCAALSQTLIESELFGHEQGAFTGATAARIGRIESARQGSLLLDEISEIPVEMQAKLLRVLEESEFQRVGANETLAADVRVIATTNRSLEDEIEAGRFRHDLYYRLSVLHMKIPPLRERPEDIPILVDYFVRRYGSEGPCQVSSVSKIAMKCLLEYEWPGNVRQLRNVIHRACVVAESEAIQLGDIGELTATADRPDTMLTGRQLTDMSLAELERFAVLSCLRRFRGNRAATARHLGVSDRTLFNKLRSYKRDGVLTIDSQT